MLNLYVTIMKPEVKLIIPAARLYEGHFPLHGIFRAERHFLLFKDQLAESGRQKKTKENIIPRGKFRLVENSSQGTLHLTISMRWHRATGKIQRNNYHHGSCGPSLRRKTMSVFLIFTQGTDRNVKNRRVRSSL